MRTSLWPAAVKVTFRPGRSWAERAVARVAASRQKKRRRRMAAERFHWEVFLPSGKPPTRRPGVNRAFVDEEFASAYLANER